LVGGAGAVIFIREHAGLEPGGTNRKAGSGWRRFIVQKQVVDGEICISAVKIYYIQNTAKV
jgi:hypothetical protein